MELFLRKELLLTTDDIKQITMLKINLLVQRNNEPHYKREIDQKLMDDKNG